MTAYKVGILPLQEVEIWNVRNGNRLSTYVLPGDSGSGIICLNGVAAHLCNTGDFVIISAYRKSMEFIDKNNKIIFQIMHYGDIENTANCISQVFSNFEPIAKALNISFNEFYGLAIPVCQKAADEQISIIAKDQKTGEVVGFIISEDFMTIDPEPPEGIDNKFQSVFSFLSELEETYRSCHPVKAGEVLHIFMLGVKEKYTKRHIATNLVRENLNLAKYHNFKVAIAEATGVGSQNLFRRLGFTQEFAIEYKSYKFKCKQIFSSIENPPNCLLMSSPI